MVRPRNLFRALFPIGSADATLANARRRKKSGLAFENLEGRVVLSGISIPGAPGSFGGGEIGQSSAGGGSTVGGGHGSTNGGGSGSSSGGCGTQSTTPGGTGVQGTSSLLKQDTHLVQQAFQTFDSAYLAAVSALRLTATSTSGPSSAGLTAFATSISTATTALNSSISTDLANLPLTGSALATTIDGYTATLQMEVDSAASGLANSTSASVLATNKEVNTDLKSAMTQTSTAILGDSPTGTLTTTTLTTFDSTVLTALQTFNKAITTAEQAAITGGTTLSSSAVSSAVTTLETALASAVSGLGTSFTASTYNPTSAITSDLTALTTTLTGITVPTSGSTSSAHTFSKAVNSALMQEGGTIFKAIATSIQDYNNSLL